MKYQKYQKNKLWQISSIVLVLTLLFLTACTGRYSSANFKLIANNPLKAQDGGFNQATWDGMIAVDSNLNENLDVVYPETQDNPNMITPAISRSIDDGYQVMVMPGFTYDKTVLQNNFFDIYNKTYFLTVDVAKFDDITKNNENKVDKYYEILVDESKPGFAAAIDVAGQVVDEFRNNKQNMNLPVIRDNSNGNITVKFTAIGGLNIPPIKNYMIGFNKGLKWFSDNVLEKDDDTKNGKLNFEWYEGTFNGGFGTDDAIKGAKANTKAALDKQVGVIFNISVPEGNTILKEIKANGSNAWFIGVDVDQAKDINLKGYSDLIKTSALKDISFAVREMLLAIKERIADNDAINLRNTYSVPGTHSFIWSKTKDVALVPMNNKTFDQLFTVRVDAKRLESLKNALDIDVSELKQCNGNMLGNINNEAVCK